MVKVKRAIIVIMAVAVIAVTSVVFVGCARKTESDLSAADYGSEIKAKNVSVEYDGEYHGIEIEGIREGDRIYYSENGSEWSEEEIKFKDKGKYTVYYRVERENGEKTEGKAELYIHAKILNGVTADDAVFRYDGKVHGIEINGIKDGDRIYYSTDGESFKEEIELKEVGEYTVYYRVERGYAEYADTVKVVIKENTLGKYISADGIIDITEENEEEYEIKNGKIAENGVEYEKLKSDERAYRVNREKYVKGKEEIEIAVEIENETAKISADGKEIKEYENVNYCESINGEEPKRNVENNNVTAKIKHKEEITEIEIELGKRARNDIGEIKQRKKYTGEAQTVDLNEGMRTIGEIPKFTEVGKYEFTLSITEAGYLPERVNVKLEIYKIDDGTYYSEAYNGMVEIENGIVKYNGEEITEEPEETDNGIRLNGKEYVRLNSTDRLCRIEIYGKIYIRILESFMYAVTAETSGERTTVAVKDAEGQTIVEEETDRAPSEIVVNGRKLDSVPDEGYIFTQSDFADYAVSLLVIG